MKLYEVPRNTRILVWLDNKPQTLFFHHIDGMYSYCTRESDNEVVHIVAYAEVEVVNV